MSNYYRIVKKRILEEYKLLGLGEKFWYYVAMFFGFFSIVGFYRIPLEQENSDIYRLLYIALGVGCFLFSKFWGNKITKEQWEITKKISKDPLLTLKSVNSLIDELEKSLANLKNISHWAVGIFTTLIVLVSTLVSNIFFEFVDIVVKGLEEEEVKVISKQIIDEFNQSGMSGFDVIFENGGGLLLLFIMPIAFGYFGFSTFSFIKKQILSILYDARYHLLIDSNEETAK